ncbi:hypothetical protein F0562_025760 [Nyssa sinensis]|uniref:Reverse transcriptase domain-containing protein n=1 Tax=Nyssa sinensis TaxID=561372 RepID=A0A5J5B904_9ASTE|nr:hypothetical protein F0562_025760 [Nyssa sinensis]
MEKRGSSDIAGNNFYARTIVRSVGEICQHDSEDKGNAVACLNSQQNVHGMDDREGTVGEHLKSHAMEETEWRHSNDRNDSLVVTDSIAVDELDPVRSHSRCTFEPPSLPPILISGCGLCGNIETIKDSVSRPLLVGQVTDQVFNASSIKKSPINESQSLMVQGADALPNMSIKEPLLNEVIISDLSEAMFTLHSAYELQHFLKNKRGGKDGYVALKLDMNKVYDRVEWEFLGLIMDRSTSR